MRRRWIVAISILIAGAIVAAALLLLRDRSDEMMRRAQELRDVGRAEEAAELFGQVALMAPGSPLAPEARFEEGFTYYVVMAPQEPAARRNVLRAMAEEAFRRLIEDYPESEYVQRVRLFLGEIYTAMGDHERALEQYEAAIGGIDDLESRQQVCLAMAQCYERSGQVGPAVERLRDIINIGRPGRYFEAAHLMLARYYYVAGHRERAVEQLRELLGTEVAFSSRQEAYVRLVEILVELERFDEANAALTELEVTLSNRALIEDLRDRISRRSQGHDGD